MKIEITRRKVYIEIIDHTQVRITNAFSQKVFNMKRIAKDKLRIDLVSLSLVEGSCKFFASIGTGSGIVGDPYAIYVNLYNPTSMYGYGVIDIFVIGEKREGIVEATVVENDG